MVLSGITNSVASPVLVSESRPEFLLVNFIEFFNT
jgi:hypothetical protein